MAPIFSLNKEIQSGDNIPVPEKATTTEGRTDDQRYNQNTFTLPFIDTDTLFPQENEIVGANPQFPQIQRMKFSISLLDEAGRKVHIFTSIQKEPEFAPTRQVDPSDMRMRYPPLVEYYKEGWTRNPVFSFEAYLNVNDDIPIHHLLFALEFTIELAGQTFFDYWQSSTRIYKSGNEVDLSGAIYLSRPGDGHWEYLECLEQTQINTAKLAIPLKSRWWSYVLTKIISKGREAEKSANLELINKEYEKTRHYIESISVFQEIWAAPRGTDLLRQRVITFL